MYTQDDVISIANKLFRQHSGRLKNAIAFASKREKDTGSVFWTEVIKELRDSAS